MEINAYGTYNEYRDMCNGMKDDEYWQLKAAKYISEMLPLNAVVVPMSQHVGFATYMHNVAKAIKNFRKDVRVMNLLRSRPYESRCYRKRLGLPDTDLHFYVIDRTLKPLCVIDNVYDTGKTWKAVRKVLEDAGMKANLYVIGKNGEIE